MYEAVTDLAPRIAAGAVLLAGAVAAIHLHATRRAGSSPRARSDGGTRMVRFGCYVLAVAALFSPVAPLPLVPLWAQWAGVANAGFGAVLRLRGMARARAIGDVLLWTGVAAASSSLPLWSALLVTLLAAHALRIAAPRTQ
jgi:hypothetical protein